MFNRIKELRQELGITQKELAKHLGIAQNTLSYWENGKFDVDNASLCRIADYFHVTIDYLLGQNKSPIDSDSTISIKNLANENDGTLNTYRVLTNSEKELIKKYRLLDQHGQKAVNSVLDIELERCSKTGDSDNLVEIPYVARSGERGTVTKSQEEIDEILKDLKPDTSGRF